MKRPKPSGSLNFKFNSHFYLTMLDQRTFFAAKYWRACQEIGHLRGKTERERAELILVTVAAWCVMLDQATPHELTEKIRRGFDRTGSSLEMNPGRRESPPIEEEFARYAGIDPLLSVPFEGTPELVNLTRAMFSDLHIDEARFVFDDVFWRLTEKEHGIDRRHAKRVAAFSSVFSTSSRAHPYCEYFFATGELACQTALAQSRKEHFGLEFIDTSFYVKLRLAVMGVRVNQWDRQSHMNCSLVQLDQPTPGRVSRRTLFEPKQPSSNVWAAIDDLLQNSWRFQTAVAVLKEADTRASGIRSSIRRWMLIQRRVRALVDFPSYRRGVRQNLTLLVFSDKEVGDVPVLCINAHRLIPGGPQTSGESGMRAAAELIRLFSGDPRVNLDRFSRESKDDAFIIGLFKHEFSEGYQDVPGLCRAVNVREFEREGWVLSANRYLVEHGGERWLPSLDSKPLLNLLETRSRQTLRAYVIGNNGEGKSLLLRELVTHLARASVKTAGIAFSSADRFSASLAPEIAEKFLYLGASGKTASAKRTSETISRLVVHIHSDQARLDIFTEIMDLLGFAQARYLLPRSAMSPSADSSSLAERAIQLSNNAKANRSLIHANEAYDLAVMHVRAKTEVVPFSELSSGEQQMLSLAIKLLWAADKDVVLLVDEPEISLHAGWQRAIPTILEIISRQFKCSMVIATHSPIVVSSATNTRDHCYLAVDNGLVEILPGQRQSVESVLLEGFHTYTANNRRVSERCAAIVAEAIRAKNDSNFAGPVMDGLIVELKQMILTVKKAAGRNILTSQQSDLKLIRMAQTAVGKLAHAARSTL